MSSLPTLLAAGSFPLTLQPPILTAVVIVAVARRGGTASLSPSHPRPRRRHRVVAVAVIRRGGTAPASWS
jgi:hypothetical protein